jgi:hypothetical protein
MSNVGCGARVLGVGCSERRRTQLVERAALTKVLGELAQHAKIDWPESELASAYQCAPAETIDAQVTGADEWTYECPRRENVTHDLWSVEEIAVLVDPANDVVRARESMACAVGDHDGDERL